MELGQHKGVRIYFDDTVKEGEATIGFTYENTFIGWSFNKDEQEKLSSHKFDELYERITQVVPNAEALDKKLAYVSTNKSDMEHAKKIIDSLKT